MMCGCSCRNTGSNRAAGIQFGLAAAFGPGLLLTCGLLVWALVLGVLVIRSSGNGVGKAG